MRELLSIVCIKDCIININKLDFSSMYLKSIKIITHKKK